jgi:histidinol-phosphatase (PHP family)
VMDWGDAAMVVDPLRVRAPMPKHPVGVLSDYHVHTCWSDGVGTVEELIARAADLGLPEVGLTDHLVPFDPDDDYGIPHHRLGDYAAAVREAAAAAQSRARVLAGIEVDYAPQTWGQMVGLVAEQSFDYVIGSVHAVDGKPVDYIEETVLLNWPSEDVLYSRYYGAVGGGGGPGG